MPAGNCVIYKAKPVPATGAELILGASPAHPGSWPLSPALFSSKLTPSLLKNCSGLKPEWKLWEGTGGSTQCWSLSTSAWQDRLGQLGFAELCRQINDSMLLQMSPQKKETWLLQAQGRMPEIFNSQGMALLGGVVLLE